MMVLDLAVDRFAIRVSNLKLGLLHNSINIGHTFSTSHVIKTIYGRNTVSQIKV